MSSKIEELELRLVKIETRITKIDIRDLKFVLYIQTLISNNKLKESINFGSDEGNNLTELLEYMWNKIMEDGKDDG